MVEKKRLLEPEIMAEILTEHIEMLRKEAHSRGETFEALSKEEIINKIKRKTSKSPFFSWQSWGHGSRGDTITYRAGIHNPDPRAYSEVWLFCYLFFGPANFISDVDQALLSVDYRFPSYAKGISVNAGGSADASFSVTIPTDIDPGTYIGNCFLVYRNSFDVGSYYDRAAFRLIVS